MVEIEAADVAADDDKVDDEDVADDEDDDVDVDGGFVVHEILCGTQDVGNVLNDGDVVADAVTVGAIEATDIFVGVTV